MLSTYTCCCFFWPIHVTCESSVVENIRLNSSSKAINPLSPCTAVYSRTFQVLCLSRPSKDKSTPFAPILSSWWFVFLIAVRQFVRVSAVPSLKHRGGRSLQLLLFGAAILSNSHTAGVFVGGKSRGLI